MPLASIYFELWLIMFNNLNFFFIRLHLLLQKVHR